MDDVKIRVFIAQRLEIEATEPPPLRVLDMICHNELCRAMDYSEKYCVQIKWYQRYLSQLMDINDHKIKCPSFDV
jgi:hypothetical protein